MFQPNINPNTPLMQIYILNEDQLFSQIWVDSEPTVYN